MRHPATDWRSKAAALPLRADPVIDGRRAAAGTAARFMLYDPASGRPLLEAPDCGQAEVDAAVASAYAALAASGWGALAPAERGRALHRFASRIEADAETLGLLDTLQMGMPVTQSVGGVAAAAQSLHVVAELAEHLRDVVMPSAADALVLQARRPLGVVAAITAWNFPVHVALAKVGPALAAGNAVILKPSELAPLACLRLAELASEAGLPPGLLNVLPGRGSTTGQALALHPQVDALAFVGSTRTGLQLLQHAGRSNMKKLLLECGGKSPQIVFDAAGDLDSLADRIVEGFTFNSGQVCTSGSRILVSDALHELLLPRLAERVAVLGIADPLLPDTTLGPLASREQARRVRALLERAGPGERLLAQGRATGTMVTEVAPRLYASTDPRAPLMQEEIFGPVGLVTRFADEAEAVRLANGTPYGLSATIWCSDLARVLRVARGLRAGFVLSHASTRRCDLGARFMSGEPFGMSGFGADGGLEGLAAYTRLQGIACQLS